MLLFIIAKKRKVSSGASRVRWRKLAQQIEREKEEQRLAKEAAAALARKMRPKTQKEIDHMRALWSAAKALAVSQGSKEASFADLRECSGVPRLVSSKRKD